MYQEFFEKYHADITFDMEVATSDLLIPLIQNNLGIGFVPESLAQPLLNRKALVQILVDCETPIRSVKLISEKGRGNAMVADTFYRYLKSRPMYMERTPLNF